MNKLLKIGLMGKHGVHQSSVDAVFNSLDLDGNGLLSLGELAEVLGSDAAGVLRCLDRVHTVRTSMAHAHAIQATSDRTPSLVLLRTGGLAGKSFSAGP
jgi:hypothetical protein